MASHKGKYHHFSEKDGQILQSILFWVRIFKYISWHKHFMISGLSPIWKEPLLNHSRMFLGSLGNFIYYVTSNRRESVLISKWEGWHVTRIHRTYPNSLYSGEKLYFSSHFILFYKLYHTINEKEKIISVRSYLLILI